ncbi:unnamed protein product [Paramecium primaurelia]|uniref:Uncharacterized protein n=1 Tax=Paramecium primaurelia TaxID=5886 RepID=A0A8S1K3I9_PARPR|nr:unnamed protein product [Paramecium primaurelia]
MSTLYLTGPQITYDSFDSNVAKKLKDICKEMEVLIINTNQKFSSLLQSQQNSFYKAFKLVIEQMSTDFKNLQQKFDEYITYHENETEVVKTQNKLIFFRDECQVLNKLCIDLKHQNQELKQKVKELEQEINNHKFILVKQISKNSKINEEIQIMKVQMQLSQQTQLINKNNDQNITNEKKLKVPHLKLNNRYHTEFTDYDHQSISTFSNKNQIINLQKETKQKKNLSFINKTSEELTNAQSSKQNLYHIDQFFEKSYNSRTKSQQHTLKKLEQTELSQKIPERSSSNLKYNKVNSQYYKNNPSISC